MQKKFLATQALQRHLHFFFGRYGPRRLRLQLSVPTKLIETNKHKKTAVKQRSELLNYLLQHADFVSSGCSATRRKFLSATQQKSCRHASLHGLRLLLLRRVQVALLKLDVRLSPTLLANTLGEHSWQLRTPQCTKLRPRSNSKRLERLESAGIRTKALEDSTNRLSAKTKAPQLLQFILNTSRQDSTTKNFAPGPRKNESELGSPQAAVNFCCCCEQSDLHQRPVSR